MNKIILKGLDLTCYQEVLKNGLSVFIVPFDKVNGKYVTLSTPFNSTVLEFVPKGKTKYRKVHAGIAHFLEHQMFSQVHRENPMQFYSEHSCDCNASTSKRKTSYLFSGTNYFEEGLEFLLDYVQDPAITEETVQKEKGIITEELKMYQDRPDSVLYDRICFNAFHVLPFRYPVGGRVEDVENTTNDEIMDCYHTFYHPRNLFLVITGNVNPEEVMELVRQNQEKKHFEEEPEVKIKKYKEPVTVYKEYEKMTMNVQIPKVCVGIKIDVSSFSKEEIDKISNYLNFTFWCNFGATSDFKEEMLEKGILTRGINYSKERVENFFFVQCVVETPRYEEFLDAFQKKLQTMTLTEEELKRMKRVLISDWIFSSDDIYAINEQISMEYCMNQEVRGDQIEQIRALNLQEYTEFMKKLNFKHCSILVIEGKGN